MPRADVRERQAHTRAVNRACSALRKRYPDDYESLYRGFLAEARMEAYAHEGLAFKAGPRSKQAPDAPLVQPPAPPGECPGCKALHAGGHVCWDCGSDLTKPEIPVPQQIASRDEGGKAGRFPSSPGRILATPPVDARSTGHTSALTSALMSADQAGDEPPHGYDQTSPAKVATMRRMRCQNCGRDGRWMREPCVVRQDRKDRRYVSHQYVLQREAASS